MRRRSSVRITLVLIGSMLVTGGCGQQEQRHVYKNKQDCLDDWGGDEKNCEELRQNDPNYHRYGYGYFYGPRFNIGRTFPGQGSRSIRTIPVSRGGFGSFSRFHASFGG